MANRVLRVREHGNDELRQGIAKIQHDLGVSPDFSPEVEQAATEAAGDVTLPELDLTELPFLTIDPESAMDLDQAMHLSREGEGYLVRYAIADVAAFVRPGGPIDLEAHRRGETLYGADSKVPLHPKSLSEDAASLLPEKIRPALVWSIALDADGKQTSATVERARVRSVRKLDYTSVQKSLDDGSADQMLHLLKEIGELRIALERERGGINLPMPEQEIRIENDQWSLEFRSMLPVEAYNAQLSLLTGFAAAGLMIGAKIGILRTMPPPAKDAVRRLRRTAKALKVQWPDNIDYPEFIRALEPAVPAQAALIVASTSLLRGAGYSAFESELPELTSQSALAADYAHVTAPLRRLVDRYALEICVSVSAGVAVPEWVVEVLPELPATMQESTKRANAYERAVVDLVESHLLAGRVGEEFAGTITEAERDNAREGIVVVQEPAIEAKVAGEDDLPVGEEVTVTLATADPATRTVAFTVR